MTNVRYAYVDGDGQVMAVTSSPNPPAPTKWETDHGYTRIELTDDMELSRDIKLEHKNGVATKATRSINPVQPALNPKDVRLAELKGKIENDTDTPEEFREYVKLRDGLF